jgi:hypothetical protein
MIMQIKILIIFSNYQIIILLYYIIHILHTQLQPISSIFIIFTFIFIIIIIIIIIILIIYFFNLYLLKIYLLSLCININ